ncbi:MAG: RNA methyltransferase [Clostridia bacterium]|nr:RNA methyltransferase [Clostridia bacterium]
MITAKDNDTVKRVTKLSKSAAFRKKCGQFLAEGVRLCKDGVVSGAAPEVFVYTAESKNKYSEEFELIAQASSRICEVSADIFAKMSDTKSPQGFLCVFNMLDKQKNIGRINNRGIYLACERLQDPSNLGTILRTAEALGVDGVILSDDCCDVYSPKVVRGSMGAVFRLMINIPDNFVEYIKELTQSGIITFASTPRDALDVTEVDVTSGVMLIGNEGSGLSTEAINACKYRVMIPMKGRAESLNASAAASILLWEMAGGHAPAGSSRS